MIGLMLALATAPAPLTALTFCSAAIDSKFECETVAPPKYHLPPSALRDPEAFCAGVMADARAWRDSDPRWRKIMAENPEVVWTVQFNAVEADLTCPQYGPPKLTLKPKP